MFYSIFLENEIFRTNLLTFPEFTLSNKFREIPLDSGNMRRLAERVFEIGTLVHFWRKCAVLTKIQIDLVTDNSVFR